MVGRATLTDQAIRALTPREKGHRTLWDGSLKGFGCCVSQGGAKSFVVLLGSGRTQTLGRYPLLSLAEARRMARERLAEKMLGKAKPERTAYDDALADFLKESEQRNRERTTKDYK